MPSDSRDSYDPLSGSTASLGVAVGEQLLENGFRLVVFLLQRNQVVSLAHQVDLSAHLTSNLAESSAQM